MLSLLLFTWLRIDGVKAGQTFKDCLTTHNDTTSYNNLLNFSFNNTNAATINLNCNFIGNFDNYIVYVYCNSSQCFIPNNCDGEIVPAVHPSFTSFACTNISEMVTCDNYASCGGIIGEELITKNTTKNSCNISSLNTAINYARSANSTYIHTNDYYCGWDNGGWTCQNSSNNCALQWTVSRPAFSTTTAGSSTSTPDNSSIPTADPSVNDYPNNSDLSKILPPIIGGSLIITAATGYCCYKKRKKKVLLIAGSGEEKTQKVEKTTQEVVNIEEEENSNKREELLQLVKQIKSKIGANLEITLETLLDTQAEITQGNNTFVIRQLQREAKQELRKNLTIEETNNLCRLQSEVTQLEMENDQQIQAQIEVVPQRQIITNPQ